MKIKAILLSFILLSALVVGCAQEPATDTTTTTDTTTDVVSTASIVSTPTEFEKAIGTDGTWIIATTQDITVDKDLVLDGIFLTGDKDETGNDEIKRKIGLYTQDENRNITARFVLTAPKLTINSPNASIEHGTFIGDVYVSAENFQLKDATIQGNLYFTTPEAQSTFKMDETSKVTGAQELVQQ